MAACDPEPPIVDDNSSGEEEDSSCEEVGQSSDSSEPKRVVYCGVCTMPIEFCEWSGSYDACRAWLEAHHGEIAAAMQPGEDKASTKMKKSAKKAAAGHSGGPVTITLLTRNAKKHVTSVEGLASYEGIDYKSAAKFFANHFSCGAAHVKGTEQIEIQGSYANQQLVDLIRTNWPQIPAENISLSNDGGSKKGRKRVPGRGGRGRGKRNTIDIGPK